MVNLTMTVNGVDVVPVLGLVLAVLLVWWLCRRWPMIRAWIRGIGRESRALMGKIDQELADIPGSFPWAQRLMEEGKCVRADWLNPMKMVDGVLYVWDRGGGPWVEVEVSDFSWARFKQWCECGNPELDGFD